VPLAVSLTAGNRHDVTQLIPLIDAIGPVAGKRGRLRQRPDALYGDRGYDYDKHRRLLRKRGVQPKIARRGAKHGSGLGKVRWVIERTFAWLHSLRRLRTRYERSGSLHNAFLMLGAAVICQRLLP
jgi:transposase